MPDNLREIDTVSVLNELENEPAQEPTVIKKPKKEKPVIRVRRPRPKKQYEIREKKVIREDTDRFGSTLVIQFPEELEQTIDANGKPVTSRVAFMDDLKAIPGVHKPTYHSRIPYNPDGSIPEEKLTFLSVYQTRASEETLQAVAKFGKSYRFAFDSDIAVRAQMSTEEGKELEKLSYAKSYNDLKLPRYKFKTNPDTKKPYAFKPFQQAGIAYALKAKRTFIADEMGLGKTVEGFGTIACDLANQNRDGLIQPWLIVVPASLRINWFKEVRRWLPNKIAVTMIKNKYIQTREVVKKKGRTRTTKTVLTAASKRFLAENQIFITTYDKVHRFGDVLKRLEWRGVIFDESHYLKGRGSKRMMSWRDWVHEQDPEFILLLSGTPLMNRPMDLLSQLNIMKRLADFGGYNHFITRFCTMSTTDTNYVSDVHKASKPLTDEDGNEIIDVAGTMNKSRSTTADILQEAKDERTRKLYANMIALNKSLRSVCYIRREKKDVLKDLPEKTRQTLSFEITNRKDYEAIEADVIGYLMEKVAKDEKFLQTIKKFSREKQQALIAQRKAEKAASGERAEALQRIEALKQAAAVGKMKAVKEWIDDFLESGKKLVVFATHNMILNELEAMYEGRCVSIRSGMSPERRDQSVTAFQTDKKTKLIFIGLKMAEGLTLTAASDTLTVEFGWNPAKHDQAEDRVHRIGQREAVVAYYAVAVRTIEEKIGRLIEKKRRVVNAVADGDPLKDADSGTVLGELLGELTGGLHLYA